MDEQIQAAKENKTKLVRRYQDLLEELDMLKEENDEEGSGKLGKELVAKN